MVLNLGDVAAGSTLYVPFATYNSSGASVTITGLATSDIEIYKNGSVTQRSSDAGYALLDTDGIDFDGITGIHGFSIDLSDNTDAGFYAAGSVYWLVVSAITVDSQTVNFVYYFTIDKNNVLRPTTAGRTLDVASTGEAGVDFDNILFSGNGPIPAFGVIDRGTAQAADANGITLRAGFSTAAANMVGVTAWIYSSTNGLHARGLSTAYNNTTKVLTLSGLGEAPTGTVLYALFASAPGSALSVNLEDNAITAAKIASSAITDAKIATGAITAAKFAAGAIDAAAIATGAIDADAIADNAIDAGAIASNAITSAKIASGAITTATFAAGAIDAAAIAANAIGASELAADAATEIANAVLTAATAAPIAANMEQINTVPVTGDGSGSPFAV